MDEDWRRERQAQRQFMDEQKRADRDARAWQEEARRKQQNERDEQIRREKRERDEAQLNDKKSERAFRMEQERERIRERENRQKSSQDQRERHFQQRLWSEREKIDRNADFAIQKSLTDLEGQREHQVYDEKVQRLRMRHDVAMEEIRKTGNLDLMNVANRFQEKLLELEHHYYVERENVLEQGRRFEFERKLTELDRIHNQIIQQDMQANENYLHRVREELTLQKIDRVHRAIVDIKMMREEAQIRENESILDHRQAVHFEKVRGKQERKTERVRAEEDRKMEILRFKLDELRRLREMKERETFNKKYGEEIDREFNAVFDEFDELMRNE